jgi:hypothetical protein
LREVRRARSRNNSAAPATPAATATTNHTHAGMPTQQSVVVPGPLPRSQGRASPDRCATSSLVSTA